MYEGKLKPNLEDVAEVGPFLKGSTIIQSSGYFSLLFGDVLVQDKAELNLAAGVVAGDRSQGLEAWRDQGWKKILPEGQEQ
jgi:hypothetical protein